MRVRIEGPCVRGWLLEGARDGLWWEELLDGSVRVSVWRVGELVEALLLL